MMERFRSALPWLAVMLLVCAVPTSGRDGSGGYAGDDTCADCHDDVMEGVAATVHGQLPERLEGEGGSCEGCHGPGAAHARSNGRTPNFDFGADYSAKEKSARCLGCHAENSANHEWLLSPHLKGGVACNDCHSTHGHGNQDKLLPADTVDMCLECHSEIAPQTRFIERHRLHAGIVACTDCHNPHGPSTRAQLGGFKHETCFKCHTDKQGPFIYEHGSVRVEGCIACHDPHGSVTRHMLRYQNVADLCLSCHAVIPGFHSRFVAGSQCTNCHVEIHGSNLHEAFLQ